MAVYMLTYDIRNPARRKLLTQELEDNWGAVRGLKSVWFFQSEDGLSRLVDHFSNRKFIRIADYLFVSRVLKEYCDWERIDENAEKIIHSWFQNDP